MDRHCKDALENRARSKWVEFTPSDGFPISLWICEQAFVKTLDSESDESLTVNIHGSYIVRTIDLENINRIRVTVGDDRMVQVRYNQ